MKRAAASLVLRWEALLVLLIVLAGVWSTTLSDRFFTWPNLLDLLTLYIFIGLLALGLALVVIAGEIDISVASILAVSVVVLGEVFEAGANVWLAALVALLVATGLGLLNGVLVGIVGLPSLAVTLGTFAAYRGLAFLIHSGEGVTGFPQQFLNIGSGYVTIRGQFVPIALFVFLGATVALAFLLHATRFGRYLFAIGSNREAARYSGIPVTWTRIVVFGVSGLMAGIAGLVYVGYFGSTRADSANDALLDVVTVVVLGGVNIFGGSGTIAGVALALVLVAELRNGMLLDNIGGDRQNIVIGCLLLGAILAGNAIRALQAGGFRPRIARIRKKEVVRPKGQAEGVS
jgi:rhamnose transport system permease protein